MRRYAPILLLALLWLTPSCKLIQAVASDVPEPPIVGDDCQVPEGDPYLAAALSDELLPDLSQVPTDPAGARAEAERLIAKANFEMRIKKGDGPEAHRSITLPRLILLASDYATKSDIAQAVIPWHEYGHVLQYKDLGTAVFLSRYGFSMGRIAAELPAKRLGFRLMRHMGIEVGLEDYKRVARDFHEGYNIVVPVECVEAWAIQAWDET